jgi:hypothetical protein
MLGLDIRLGRFISIPDVEAQLAPNKLREHADLVPDHIRSNATAQSSTAPIKRRGRAPKTGGPDR